MADININLQTTRNAIATANNLVLTLNQNQFYIVAGEQNATTFEIKYNASDWTGYSFYVEMVNALGYGIAETKLENGSSTSWVTSATTFILPEGMAVAGYAYISVKAKKNSEVIVFMPIKLPVSNTIPTWQQSITDAMGAEVNAEGHLIVRYDNGMTEDLGLVVGNGIVSVAKTGTNGLVDTYTQTYLNGDTFTYTVTNGKNGEVAEFTNDSASTATVSLSLETNTVKCFSGVKADAVNITIPATFVGGCFCEVDFVASTTLAANGVSITNNTSQTLKMVQYGSVIDTYYPPANAGVTMLFQNNGINIICSMIEV